MQLSLDIFATELSPALQEASQELALAEGEEARGAVFTRRAVVDSMLDLMGYTADQPLTQRRLLEPSVGQGAFLWPILERLWGSFERQGWSLTQAVPTLRDALRAVELHQATLDQTHARVIAWLQAKGLTIQAAKELADHWLQQGDFLLTRFEAGFDYVVGNPPYVRQERIPELLLTEYRRRYRTLYDRADLYVPFFERGLQLLQPQGMLCFICADRWMKNRYGGPLRRLIARDFHLAAYVDLYDVSAFDSEVIAYPAITLLQHDRGNETRLVQQPQLALEELQSLVQGLRGESSHPQVRVVREVARQDEPWLLGNPAQLQLLRRLEAELPTLEATGVKVGIGVATGVDKAFIGPFEQLDVEPSRKLPLATTKDINSGKVDWQGQGVINPYEEDGSLVDLAKYPRLHAYLMARREAIAARHCARKQPDKWYRTIDRIVPSLTQRPKLLIPDIKGSAHVVYEPGQLYPHHNLYYLVSDTWDLQALQAVLLSDLTRMFISAYSTKMRGGYLRFQAQYLRRIRLPQWKDVRPVLQADLTAAAQAQDIAACNRAVAKLYQLSEVEQKTLTESPD